MFTRYTTLKEMVRRLNLRSPITVSTEMWLNIRRLCWTLHLYAPW